MTRQADVDQGFSIKLDRDVGELIKKLSEKEDRSLKRIVERAVRKYAGETVGE